MGGDWTKRCGKMKRRQQAHFDSVEIKCDTALWRGDVGRSRGGTGEGKQRRCEKSSGPLLGLIMMSH
jgi:hypothetical protein